MIQTTVYTAFVDCLKDPALYELALSLLPAQRRESADRMKIGSGKRLSAGAGLLLMAALADALTESVSTSVPGVSEPGLTGTESCIGSGQAEYRAGHSLNVRKMKDLSALRFSMGEHGKPYLPDYPQVHFNLSHSGSRVMCIVSPCECGCDVEQVDRRQKQIDMVIRCLAESEQRLAAVCAVQFYRIWTLKESILKLSGKGILVPLNSFEVSLEPLAVRQDFFSGPVILKEYTALRDDYCCSCALAGGTLPDGMVEVDLREVLERSASAC